MLRRMLSGSRYLILIAVLGSFLASAVTLIYDGLTVVGFAIELVTHPDFTPTGAKHIAVESIEITDLFLLGTVFYIVSLGLYELFIDKVLPVRSWLVIESLDDLKERLVGVVIVLLAVTFLSYVVNWDGTTNILALGVAVGLVLFALGVIFRLAPIQANKHGTSTNEESSGTEPEP